MAQQTDVIGATLAPRRDPAPLRALAVLSSTLNRIAAVVAAILLVAMVALILTEIVLRLFSRSTYMTDVLVGYGVAAITFLALGWAMEQGSMIRVSVLTDRMGRRTRWIAEAFAIISAEAMTVFLITHQWASVLKLWQRGSLSPHFFPIPLWIPEAIFLVGLVLLALHLLVRAGRLVTGGHRTDKALTI